MNWKRLIAPGLIGASLIGFGAMYGPVVLAEASYQAKKMFLSPEGEGFFPGGFLPRFSFEVMPKPKDETYTLVIPDLFLNEEIVANVDPANKREYDKALGVGIAHAAGSMLPGGKGVGYYFAHSSGGILGARQKPIFYRLEKLEDGDSVYIYHEGEKFSYTVTEKKVVKPTEVRWLRAPVGGEEEIVLQTCWPIGSDAKRLLVFARRV